MKVISDEVLKFLTALRENNNREWFNERKPKFKALEKEVKAFYADLGLLMSQHDDIEKIKPYRIYRDIRFSKDKTPYKSHFAVNFMRRKPELRGGYYMRIKPGGNSFVGGGFWNPSRRDLERVRKEWELDTEEIREIMMDPVFHKFWGEMQGEQLKTAPRGFDREHPDIALINYKQWTFSHTFTDEEVLAPDFAETVNAYFRSIRPFFDYMSEILNTDLNGVSILE